MDEATFVAEQERVQGIWNRWVPILGLDEWAIRIDFSDGEYIAQGGYASGDAVATTFARWEYRHASVAWNLALTAGSSDERVEEYVVHEAMHILVNEMRTELPVGYVRDEDDAKHEERVCQSLAWAFLRAREANDG